MCHLDQKCESKAKDLRKTLATLSLQSCSNQYCVFKRPHGSLANEFAVFLNSETVLSPRTFVADFCKISFFISEALTNGRNLTMSGGVHPESG